MSKKIIEPFRVYTVQEASDLIGSSERAMIHNIKNKTLNGKKIGKGYKVLGENILRYLGSASVESPPHSLGTPSTTHEVGKPSLPTNEYHIDGTVELEKVAEEKKL